MPVTHGVAGSSPVRTAKSLGEIQGFFGFKYFDFIHFYPSLALWIAFDGRFGEITYLSCPNLKV